MEDKPLIHIYFESVFYLRFNSTRYYYDYYVIKCVRVGVENYRHFKFEMVMILSSDREFN
ncbi:hypothetical protein BLOT_010955 [Blomia tropicalis]|nr:hypothetical protein BLOT_010955 [Blomia tropicalis]